MAWEAQGESNDLLTIRRAEAIFQKCFQRDVLLANETLLRQLAGSQQIKYRTRTRRRRNLNRRHLSTRDQPTVNLIGVRFLHQSALSLIHI